MPKLKTRKAASKRYKKVGLKNFKRKKAYRGHLLQKKSAKQKRLLSTSPLVHKSEVKAIRRMLLA